MRALVHTGVAVCMAAQTASAGPWAREAGDVFLSFSVETSIDRTETLLLPEYDATLYAEAGLGKRFTLGADLYQGPEAQTYLVFVQRTFSRGDARHQFALRLGAGTARLGTQTTSLALVGAAWGMGFDTRWGGGWATVDAQTRARESGGRETKIDATLGLKPMDGWSIIAQIQAADYPEAPETVRLQGSVVRQLNDRFSIETGLIYGLHNSARAGLKIGLWTQF